MDFLLLFAPSLNEVCIHGSFPTDVKGSKWWIFLGAWILGETKGLDGIFHGGWGQFTNGAIGGEIIPPKRGYETFTSDGSPEKGPQKTRLVRSIFQVLGNGGLRRALQRTF